MKNYKVRITRNFYDSVENVDRFLGNKEEEFMCTKKRYEYLASCDNAVELVEIVEEEKGEADYKPKKKPYRK